MLMKKLCCLLFLALAAAGCSPGDSSPWILGTFSNVRVGVQSHTSEPVTHYEFREDGALVIRVLKSCEPNRGTVDDELQWSTEGDSLVVAEVTDNTFLEALHFKPGENCNRLQVNMVDNGTPSVGLPLWRGAVCFNKLPPCPPDAQQCDSCETVWCDEPPPPCTD